MKKDLSVLFLIFSALFLFNSCGSEESKPAAPEKIESGDFLIPFQAEKDGKWGFMNIEGQNVIDTIFEKTPTYFREGYSLIRFDENNVDFIDSTGKLVGKKYKNASLFSNGLACVTAKGQAPAFVNKDFEEVFTIDEALYAGMFSEGLARFTDKDEKWGFVNTKGEIVVEPKYDNAMNFTEGLAFVAMKDSSKTSVGFIDKEGNVVIGMNDSITTYQYFKEGLAAFYDGSGWGFIDKTGKVVIEATPDRSDIIPFDNGFCSFKEGGQWGLMDKTGKKVILPKYEYPLSFKNGIAAIVENGKYGFINRDEEVIIPAKIKEIALPFIGKNTIGKYGNYYYLIDMNGKVVSENGIRQINPYFMGMEETRLIVESDTPEMAKILEKKKAEEEALRKKQKEEAAKQMADQQQQMPMKPEMPSGKELARELARAYEEILQGDNMEQMAMALQQVQYQVQMVLMGKQKDKKFLESFKKESEKLMPSLQVKYQDKFMKLQKFIMKAQQDAMKKQKEPQGPLAPPELPGPGTK